MDLGIFFIKLIIFRQKQPTAFSQKPEFKRFKSYFIHF